MHSPALHNDKDPYELSVISEPSVEGGGGWAWAGCSTQLFSKIISDVWRLRQYTQFLKTFLKHIYISWKHHLNFSKIRLKVKFSFKYPWNLLETPLKFFDMSLNHTSIFLETSMEHHLNSVNAIEV